MIRDTTESNILKVVEPYLSKVGFVDMNLKFQNHLKYTNRICSPQPTCLIPAGKIKEHQNHAYKALSKTIWYSLEVHYCFSSPHQNHVLEVKQIAMPIKESTYSSSIKGKIIPKIEISSNLLKEKAKISEYYIHTSFWSLTEDKHFSLIWVRSARSSCSISITCDRWREGKFIMVTINSKTV